MASEHFAVIDTMDNDTQDSGQLDLFRHSRAVTLTNDAIAALLARNSAHAEASVDRLRAEEPGDHTLDALSRLCRALGEWPPSTANVVEIARAIHQLEAEVQPAAAAAMGGHAVDFMRPLWRDLAQAARAHEYDKAFPQSHCAALYLCCGTLYLYTVSAERFFSRLGWSVMEHATFHDTPVAVMSYGIAV